MRPADFGELLHAHPERLIWIRLPGGGPFRELVQCLMRLLSISIAVFRRLFETFQNERDHIRAQLDFRTSNQRRHGSIHMLHHDIVGAVSRKWRLSSRKFIEHATERIDIRGLRDIRSRRLFGRHIPGRAERLTRHGQFCAVCKRRKAEIQDFHKMRIAILLCDHDVVGLEVAVYDVHRMRLGERIQNLVGNMEDELP